MSKLAVMVPPGYFIDLNRRDFRTIAKFILRAVPKRRHSAEISADHSFCQRIPSCDINHLQYGQLRAANCFRPRKKMESENAPQISRLWGGS